MTDNLNLNLKSLSEEEFNPNWPLAQKAIWALSVGRYANAIAWAGNCDHPLMKTVLEQAKKDCGDEYYAKMQEYAQKINPGE